MAHAALARTKIDTDVTQAARSLRSRAPARARKSGRPPRGPRVSGDARESVRSTDRPVIELEFGILVYPPAAEGEPWRAVFTENGQRKFRQGATEVKLAAKLEKVKERLQADAVNMERPGADLIKHYLGPDRLPAEDRWSRKHAHAQRRLCERFAAPVIGAVTCQDIKTGHMQQIVNAAPTAGEGDRVRGMLSALVAAGIEGGYLTNPRLAKVHWQAGNRPLPAQRVTVSGESALWVDPAEIPADSDIGKLGLALAAGRHGERDELMANTAAYSGLRWGELTALTIWQVDPAGRVITVDRQVIEVAGHLYVEAPKCRKYRKTIYPRRTPDGYRLAEKLAARIEQATAEYEAGINPLRLIFPSPTGKHWRSSNFNRNVLRRAHLAIGWRDADGNGRWTWHSLRHVFGAWWLDGVVALAVSGWAAAKGRRGWARRGCGCGCQPDPNGLPLTFRQDSSAR
jgi:integrase